MSRHMGKINLSIFARLVYVESSLWVGLGRRLAGEAVK